MKQIVPFLKTHSVLLCCLILLLLLASMVVFFTSESLEVIGVASVWVRNYFGSFYLWLGLGVVLILLMIACSALGKITLGKTSDKPEYNTWAWAAMLYSAGMGAGILLRAVQEPIYMQQHPPFESSMGSEVLALVYTFYHWGLTPWAFYGIFALTIGVSLYVYKRPARTSESVIDFIKPQFLRSGIDILTIITTVIGLVAAIALGTVQISSGLNHLGGMPSGIGSSVIICGLISILAAFSAWRGLNRGIKLISAINITGTLILLFFVFLMGDSSGILFNFFNGIGQYLKAFVPMSLALEGYDPGIEFLTDWTFYYWAFWISWAPFTGIFIARISKGRSLRQLILGVLVLPSLGTFFWFATFGSSAFDILDVSGAYTGQFDQVFSSIFVFLSYYPLSDVMNVLTVVLLVGFLVTSLDSAVYVLSMFSDQGKNNPSRGHRLLWSTFLFLGSVALLLLGVVNPDIDVLGAVQKILIISSLPFALFMVVMLLGFLYYLRKH